MMIESLIKMRKIEILRFNKKNSDIKQLIFRKILYIQDQKQLNFFRYLLIVIYIENHLNQNIN